MGARAFTLSWQELMATNQQNVESSMSQSRMLHKKAVQVTQQLCVFVNGEPQPLNEVCDKHVAALPERPVN